MPLDPRKIRQIRSGTLPETGDGYCYMRLIDYYDTTTWEDLRTQALRRDLGVCTECGSAYDLEVHHARYPDSFFRGKHRYINIEGDVAENLVTLCRQHHADRHPHFIIGDIAPEKPACLYEEEQPASEIDFRSVTFESDAPSDSGENSPDSLNQADDRGGDR